jgi:hypothetical protein
VDLTEEGLTQMATQLGVSLPHLWEILIKQQYIEAIQAFFGFGICLLICGFAYKKRESIEKFRKGNPDDYDNFERSVILAIFIVFLFVVVAIAFTETIINVGKIINPEFYAVQDIVEFINNIRGNE